jgi:hypothetical protein
VFIDAVVQSGSLGFVGRLCRSLLRGELRVGMMVWLGWLSRVGLVLIMLTEERLELYSTFNQGTMS